MDSNNFDSFDILDFNQESESFGTLEIDTDGDGIGDYIAYGMDSYMDGQDNMWTIDTPEVSAMGFDNDGDGNTDEFFVFTNNDGDGELDDLQKFQPVDKDGHFESAQLEEDYPPEQIEENPNDSSLIPANELDGEEVWHQQKYQDCGIVAQEFVLDEIGKDYGIDFHEDELFQEALNNDWCTASGGTPLECLGKLLEVKGIEVERQFGGSLEDINQQLQQGHHVIVAVDADEIWHPNEPDEDDLIANQYGMPGQGYNHAVQVIGIDNTNPDNPIVILNDPGTPNGQGLRVPAEDFLNAWEDSNNYMVSTTGNLITPEQTQIAMDNDQNMDGNILNSKTEGDRQMSWYESYKNDERDAQDWAKRYAESDPGKALEYEREAAEAREKASEYYQKAQEEYRNS
jgi:hypothetical protein